MDKKKILIVEDDKSALESLRKLLVMSQFEVEGCLNSEKAVEATKAFRPDIILLDLLMPVAKELLFI